MAPLPRQERVTTRALSCQNRRVLWGIGKVAQLLRVCLQVEQLLVDGVLFVEPCVDPALVTDCLALGDVLVVEAVLVEKVRTPLGRLASQQRQEALAVVAGRRSNSGQLEQGGGEVYVEHHVVVGRTPSVLVGARIDDDQRHADRLFIDQPFASQAAFAEEQAAAKAIGTYDDAEAFEEALARAYARPAARFSRRVSRWAVCSRASTGSGPRSRSS